MDLTTVVTSTGSADYTWLASRHGVGNALPRTIDVSKLTSGTHYDATTKVIPSGLVLGKVTATGLYGPYDSTASDGRQTVDSILLDPQTLLLSNGNLSTVVAGAAIVHGVIRAARLPVTAHQSITASTAGAAAFVFES